MLREIAGTTRIKWLYSQLPPPARPRYLSEGRGGEPGADTVTALHDRPDRRLALATVTSALRTAREEPETA